MTVDELLALDPATLPDAAVGDLIIELEAVIRRAQALQSAAVRVFDARDAAVADGAASTACWLRDRLGAADREARQAVGLARSLDRLPVLAAALAAGEVGLAHARTLAALTRRLDPATVAAGEEFLVGCARRLDPLRFATAVRRWVATVAPAELERDAERRYDSRWLSVSPTYGGMVSVAGMLEPEGGAIVAAAVDALVGARPAGDTRSKDQQRADALVELVELARSHELLPVSGGSRPEILVHVPAGEAAFLGNGTPLTPAAADRLGCDARFRRLVLDAAAVPVELGRATRVVPPALRKLVALRDGGCRYPGCPRGAAFCEAHHVRFWRQGGPTSAANLVLLCRFHHHLVHDRGHALALRPDGTVEATRPDGRIVTGRPRGPSAVPA
ncbi:MAG TPA: DUF222 domain-containing protein [Frankiaceae bacterium]|nr:DUF222 domain-containing protein [Frankiaceae bacterium]